jgi:hypothetical protein
MTEDLSQHPAEPNRILSRALVVWLVSARGHFEEPHTGVFAPMASASVSRSAAG